MPKPRIRVRIVGRLWTMPPVPFPVNRVRGIVLLALPDAVRVSINGAAPKFTKLDGKPADPHS